MRWKVFPYLKQRFTCLQFLTALSALIANNIHAGQYLAVATGYTQSDKNGGQFCLFDGATGDMLWQHHSPMMAWPCFISADASGIFAGSDHGVAYYFTPEPPW